LNRVKEKCKAPIVDLGSPNYFKVGAKMMDMEGDEFDVPGATSKGPSYKYYGARKFLPIPKEIFDKTPSGRSRGGVCMLFKIQLMPTHIMATGMTRTIYWRNSTDPQRRICEVEHQGSDR
jgi:hypothetical protein